MTDRERPPKEKARYKLFCLCTYPPRKCGIATFSYDLIRAISANSGDDLQYRIVAVNDTQEGYAYPEEVCFQIREKEKDDYQQAAIFVNSSNATAVLIQHEFGIYGGSDCSHLLTFMRNVRVQTLTTLHSIYPKKNFEQANLLAQIIRLSDKVVVMSKYAANILRNDYKTPANKIVFIPHGAPDIPFGDSDKYKDKIELTRKTTIMTFGLLTHCKGVQYVIKALPRIIEKHPNVVYLVIGQTHPHEKLNHGEAYRNYLQDMARRLDVTDYVVFINRYLTLDEICLYVRAADIVATPHLTKMQIASGTLTYALAAGKVIVSTPFWYAKEMLAEGRGCLVPFRDYKAIFLKIDALLSNQKTFNIIRRRAFRFSRNMLWKNVGKQYLDKLR